MVPLEIGVFSSSNITDGLMVVKLSTNYSICCGRSVRCFCVFHRVYDENFLRHIGDARQRSMHLKTATLIMHADSPVDTFIALGVFM